MEQIIQNSEIIQNLFRIVTELDARESGCNCIVSGLIEKTWDELCDDAIALIEQLKE